MKLLRANVEQAVRRAVGAHRFDTTRPTAGLYYLALKAAVKLWLAREWVEDIAEYLRREQDHEHHTKDTLFDDPKPKKGSWE